MSENRSFGLQALFGDLLRRTAPKFGTHVRIDTLTLKQNLTHPTRGGFRGLSIVKNLSRRTAHKCGTHVRIDTLTLKKLKILTHPTPGGFRRLNCLARLALARERTPSISKLEIHFVLMYRPLSRRL